MTTKTYTETNAVPYYDECDVLVVGSGCAGHSAAIAAEVRGFNLRTAASGYKEYPFAALDVAALVGSVVLVAVAVALGVLL